MDALFERQSHESENSDDVRIWDRWIELGSHTSHDATDDRSASSPGLGTRALVEQENEAAGATRLLSPGR